jgi:hypothetical protein
VVAQATFSLLPDPKCHRRGVELGFDFLNLKWMAPAVFAALLAVTAPAGAQQQGPVIPQAPAGAPQAPAGVPQSRATAASEESPPAPGTPARAEPPVREGAPLIGLPSWMERMAAGASESLAAPPLLPPDFPEKISIPAGTRIPIVLETPLNSRFSHRGQLVVFRTTGAVSLGEELQLPPGMELRGRVAEVTRPGAFGKSGALRVTVDRIMLPGDSTAALLAQLRSGDINSRGRLTNDNRRLMDRQGLVVLSVQGALAGAQFGGKAAGIGAGAGAAVAAVLMMSKKGRDVSVSPGTPFSVRLQQDADLPAPAVYWAQQDYAGKHASSGAAYDDSDDELDDGTRPVLKRRAPAPASQPDPAPAR